MQEIPTLIGYFTMNFSYTAFRLVTIFAPLLASRELTLGATEFPLPATIKFGRCNPFTIAEHSEVFESSVKPNGVIRVGRLEGNIGHLEFSSQSHVPVTASIPFEGRAFGRAVNSLRLVDANPTDFWHVDPAVCYLDALRKSEARFINLAGFEAWESRSLLEEVAIRGVQVLEGLLQELTVSVF